MLLFFPLFCGTRLPVHRPLFEFSFPTIKNKFKRGGKKKKREGRLKKKKQKTLGGLCVLRSTAEVVWSKK